MSIIYRDLDEDRIIITLERLWRRICERFPESGLSKVAEELLIILGSGARGGGFALWPPSRSSVWAPSSSSPRTRWLQCRRGSRAV